MKNWTNLENKMRPKVRYWVPAAAMDEQDLRKELQQLKERGFGGVEVVVLSMLPQDLAGSEDGWGTVNWDHMVDVIADETEKLGLSMDIAIGPGWPIASPVIKNADDPAAIRELTFGEVTAAEGYEGPLPERRIQHEEGHSQLLAVMAYEETADHVLKKDSFVDLMPFVTNGRISWKAPYNAVWKIFAFYVQPAVHKINARQTYVVDHHGEAGARAVERYWDQVFSERAPYRSMESFFCDSLEYEVSMDWTADLPEEFQKRRGYSLLPFLPFIGLDGAFPKTDPAGYRLEEESVSDAINRDYLETLTQLYTERHLAVLERIAEKYGKTIRYQVAYNKMLEVERSGLYVAIPENEALGRPSIDYMKTMAAAAHLGRKDRYSFECAAEFGHSYGQSYEDLFWWIKRAAMAGMNAQVLHGASYSGGYHGAFSEDGHLKQETWPGYEGFGKFVSNYWNRTLSIRDARGCLDAVTRINTVFRQQAKVDVLIFRDDYLSHGFGSEFCLYDDGGALATRGYSYEFASETVLCQPNAIVRDGVLDPEGTAYRCLLIPDLDHISISMLKKIQTLKADGLPVYWVGKKPDGRKYYGESVSEWEQAMADCQDIPWIEDLSSVPERLADAGILPRIALEGRKDVMTAVHEDQDARYCCLYGFNRLVLDQEHPNPDEISVSAIYQKGTIKRSYERPGLSSRETIHVRLEGIGRVICLDPFSGQTRKMPFKEVNGGMEGSVEIEEDELIILAIETGKEPETVPERHPVCTYPVSFKSIAFSSFEPDTLKETSFLRSHFEPYGQEMPLKTPLSWPDLGFDGFAGKALYKASIDLPQIDPEASYVLELGDVEDTFHLKVNGQDTPFPDQVMKRVDLTGLLQTGRNDLEIEVTSNLYNRLFTGEPIPYIMESPKRIVRQYGIKETENKKIRLIEYV